MVNPAHHGTRGFSYITLLILAALATGLAITILTTTPRYMDFGDMGIEKSSLTSAVTNFDATASLSENSTASPMNSANTTAETNTAAENRQDTALQTSNSSLSPQPQPAVYNVIGASEDYVNNLIQSVRDEFNSLAIEKTNTIYFGGGSSNTSEPVVVDLSSIDGSTITNSSFSGTSGEFSDDLSAGTLYVNGDSHLSGELTAEGPVTFGGLATSASANALCVDGNGLVSIGATMSCLGLSSERYSHDIADIDLGLAAILSMRPVSFVYEQGYGDNGQTEQFGLMAEDVYDIDSRLAITDADGLPTTVRYDFITPILIKAIQEQQLEIEQLKTTVDVSSSTPTLIAEIMIGIKNEISTAEDWVFKKITSALAVFNRVETETALVTGGLEMMDRSTDSIYCITINNGDWDKKIGNCVFENATSTDPGTPPTEPSASSSPATDGNTITSIIPAESTTTPPVIETPLASTSATTIEEIPAQPITETASSSTEPQ